MACTHDKSTIRLLSKKNKFAENVMLRKNGVCFACLPLPYHGRNGWC